MRFLRQLGMVLVAIVARPWMWLTSGVGLLAPLSILWGTLSHVSVLSPVAVVPKPPVPWSGSAIRDEKLPTIKDWHTWRPIQQEATPEGGFTVAEAYRDGLGDWDEIDRLPALERLWITGRGYLSKAGWRRIGDHPKLELLSLRNVEGWYPGVADGFARDGRDALARLPGLRHLELRGTGTHQGILLPTLPRLEACGIGQFSLEENLATLAAGSPGLRTLAIETVPDFTFTPAMVASLRRMPRLQTLLIEAARARDDEPAMLRQVAELQRALTPVRLRPGSFSQERVLAVLAAAWIVAGLGFVFWFQAGTLLATPLVWMLPRRFPAHVSWPIAVAVVCGVAFLAFCRGLGVAWLPAAALAVFASGVVAYGPVLGDLTGWPARMTRLMIAADVVVAALIYGGFIGAKAAADHWLIGGSPLTAVALLMAATASFGWKITRLGRLPSILAEGDREAVLVRSIEGGQALARKHARGPGGRFDLRWWLHDTAIDRQLARPLPTAMCTAAGFAEILGRPQHHMQSMMAGYMFVSFALIYISVGTGGSSRQLLDSLPRAIATGAFQAALPTLAVVASMWWQRRSGLVTDFLRPVSRHDYWRGLYLAILRDLLLPLAVGAALLAGAASWWGQGHPLPWLVSALGFAGVAAMAPVWLLLIATGRTLATRTVGGTLLAAAAFGLAYAVNESFFYVWYGGSPRWWRAIAGAVVLLVVGLAARAAVLWKLEDREIA
jgi:hypothetical protein